MTTTPTERSRPILPGSAPRVVATIHDRDSLAAALRLKPGQVDFLELRLDAFSNPADQLREKFEKLQLPLIITARHPKEGGIHALKLAARKKLYQQFLGQADALDMEVRSASDLADIRLLAKAAGVCLILSFHDFKSTPSPGVLKKLAQKAASFGADIFKVATTLNTPAHLATLHELVLHPPADIEISAMGMGKTGKVSRLLLAQAGSILNYGYLSTAQVPGQWPATVLKKRLTELAEG